MVKCGTETTQLCLTLSILDRQVTSSLPRSQLQHTGLVSPKVHVCRKIDFSPAKTKGAVGTRHMPHSAHLKVMKYPSLVHSFGGVACTDTRDVTQ